MLERNGMRQFDQVGQTVPTIESLVERLGVPADRVETFTYALVKAFGKEDQPDKRVREFLEFKLKEKMQGI